MLLLYCVDQCNLVISSPKELGAQSFHFKDVHTRKSAALLLEWCSDRAKFEPFATHVAACVVPVPGKKLKGSSWFRANSELVWN